MFTKVIHPSGSLAPRFDWRIIALVICVVEVGTTLGIARVPDAYSRFHCEERESPAYLH